MGAGPRDDGPRTPGTVNTGSVYRAPTRVHGPCWQKALYDSAFCKHGPWIRMLDTHYPCSRAVNTAVNGREHGRHFGHPWMRAVSDGTRSRV